MYCVGTAGWLQEGPEERQWNYESKSILLHQRVFSNPNSWIKSFRKQCQRERVLEDTIFSYFLFPSFQFWSFHSWLLETESRSWVMIASRSEGRPPPPPLEEPVNPPAASSKPPPEKVSTSAKPRKDVSIRQNNINWLPQSGGDQLQSVELTFKGTFLFYAPIFF